MPPLAVAPAIASSTPRTRRAMSHNVEAQALGATAIAENGNVVTTWPAALTAPVADSSAANVHARHAPGARGYAAADDDWTWGPVQRVDLLWAGIQRRPKHTLGSVVAAMAVPARDISIDLR